MVKLPGRFDRREESDRVAPFLVGWQQSLGKCQNVFKVKMSLFFMSLKQEARP